MLVNVSANLISLLVFRVKIFDLSFEGPLKMTFTSHVMARSSDRLGSSYPSRPEVIGKKTRLMHNNGSDR